MIATFTPPLVQQLVDRFELVETPITAEKPGERATHTERALRLWTGTASGVDDGYDFMQVVGEEFHWRANPACGDWPMVIEWFRSHDPKDDPDDSGRFFYFIRLTYIEKSVYVALYSTLADARADAWPNPDSED